MSDFTECALCTVKPGAPNLCPSCLANRGALGAAGARADAAEMERDDAVERNFDLIVRSNAAEKERDALREEIARCNSALRQYEVNKRATEQFMNAEREEWRRVVAGLLSLPDGATTVVGDRPSIIVTAAHVSLAQSDDNSSALATVIEEQSQLRALAKTLAAALEEANDTACAQNCDEEDPITHVRDCRTARAALAEARAKGVLP